MFVEAPAMRTAELDMNQQRQRLYYAASRSQSLHLESGANFNSAPAWRASRTRGLYYEGTWSSVCLSWHPVTLKDYYCSLDSILILYLHLFIISSNHDLTPAPDIYFPGTQSSVHLIFATALRGNTIVALFHK